VKFINKIFKIFKIMANNCLLTQLKGTVTGDFPKYGEVVMTVTDFHITTGELVGLRCNGAEQIRVADGSALLSTDSGFANPTDHIDNPNVTLYFKPSVGKQLIIKDYWSLEWLGANPITNGDSGTFISFDFKFGSGFMKYTSMTKFLFQNFVTAYDIPFKVSDLNSDIEQINCTFNNSVDGRFDEFGNFPNLTFLRVFNSSVIVGSIEQFVANMRAAGKTTNSVGVTVPYLANKMTIEGNVLTQLQSGGEAWIKWTENTITYDNGRADANHYNITINA
jgi:hypothetical protein